jgi:ubiquinone/menaquinone biosynthesis C-methylase UbiE
MEMSQGFYASRVFPWLNDRLAGAPEIEQLRDEALGSARGRVVEIGFGTGLNLPHYRSPVHDLVAVEPNPGMLERARARIRAVPFPVEVITGAAERLPLPDASFDTAVSVMTLCTVADPGRVVAELRRVLRPDGQLLMLEHGLAEDPGVARWQDRLDWLQTRWACGCHLNRPVRRLVQEQGFRFDSIRQFYAPKMPRTHGWVTIAVARKAMLH